MAAIRNNRRRRSGDLISSLPDPLIQHILSFLPSKDAIRTAVLSKRWNKQWTLTPALIFDSAAIDHRFFCCFIEKTLIQHDFPEIVKFAIRTNCRCLKQRIHHLLPLWIGFAAVKNVRNLGLDFSVDRNAGSLPWLLPQIVFYIVSLVNLKLNGCRFVLPQQFNWPSLKSLCLGLCFVPENTVETVLSGCPVLESLEVRRCYGFRNLVFASTSLKKLVLEEIDRVDQTCGLKVECSDLDELELLGDLFFGSLRFVNIPSSTFVTLDFSTRFRESTDDDNVYANKWFEDFIRDVQHVTNLKCDVRFMRVLSLMEVLIDWLNPLMRIKCLTVDVPYFHTSYHGIRFFLRNSPLLEKIVIRLHNDTMQEWPTHFYGDLLRDPFACYCLTTLKTVEIIDFDKKFDEDGHVLDFIKLLLQKAMVLQKVDIYQHVNSPRRFALTLSRELSRIPKCSPDVVVRLLCSTTRGHRRRQGWHANGWVAV